ncbi:MAG TPA: alpha/beta hydrolase [Allosphingosinicella sp.]|jgi:lysophospholipase
MTRAAVDRRSIPAGATLTEWRASDGWVYRRMDWPQPPGAGGRGSLLFAGGRGDFLEKHLEAYHHWHSRGWNVTTFDWRSQGGSRGDVAGQLTSLDPLIEDLQALIAGWSAELPGPHIAVAHSMGGHILLRTLAERRPALEAAVLVAPMLAINSAPLPLPVAAWVARALNLVGWERRPVWKPSQPPPPAGSRRQTYLTACRDRYEDELWWWEREPGFNLGAPSWGWMNAAYSSCRRLTPATLRQVQTPILLVGTETDRLVSAGAIRRAASLLPNAELLMFPDAGHEILREEDRVRLQALAAIDRFLDAQATR